MSLPPWDTGGLPLLSIAMTCTASNVLGPGLRFIVWAQGCRRACPDCISPEWRPLTSAIITTPEELAQRILESGASGITFSGGEPMLQASGLAQVVKSVRSSRDVSVICFTGSTIEQLREAVPAPGVLELLNEVDLLIDSPYIASLNDNRGLRG